MVVKEFNPNSVPVSHGLVIDGSIISAHMTTDGRLFGSSLEYYFYINSDGDLIQVNNSGSPLTCSVNTNGDFINSSGKNWQINGKYIYEIQ